MSDYISRQAAIEAVDECTKLKITDDFYTVYTEDMKDMITDIPAADVRENVKGEWIYTPIENGMIVAMCPICKKVSAITQSVKEWYRFCPNCGADMRGEA